MATWVLACDSPGPGTSCWDMGVQAAWFRRAYLGMGGSTTLLAGFEGAAKHASTVECVGGAFLAPGEGGVPVTLLFLVLTVGNSKASSACMQPFLSRQVREHLMGNCTPNTGCA